MSHAGLEHARGILLDFDGPVCRVFAGMPASDAAQSLRDTIRSHQSTAALPPEDQHTEDPLAVLRAAVGLGPAMVTLVDAALVRREKAAVTCATPTPGAERFLRHCAARAVPVVIVSNNSAPAIRSYLDGADLTSLVLDVVGRPTADPTLMKPHPHLVLEALRRLRLDAIETVLIGDSPSDIVAARRCQVPTIGLANAEHKVTTLATAGAHHVVTSMNALVGADDILRSPE